MMYNEWAHTYPSKDKFKSLSLSGWKYGKEGRYKTWLVNGVDTGNSQYAPFEYYNGRSPGERFVNGMGDFIVRHPDGIGFALSVGAAVSSGGLSIGLGLSALALDVISGDGCGAGIGGMALFNPKMVPLDLGYGACRASSGCSQVLDEFLK